MGLFYKIMIKEIEQEFKKSQESSLEFFVKYNEERFKEEYQIGGMMFYLNILELFKQRGESSQLYLSKFKQAQDEDFFE